MGFCPNCGTETQPGSFRCVRCGTDVSRLMPPLMPGEGSNSSGLAIASLVLGLMGLCSYGIFGVPGIILGIVAISRINKSQGRLGGKGLAIGGIAAGAGSLLFSLMLLAVLIPTTLKFIKVMEQTQAKTALYMCHYRQKAFFQENGYYANSFEELEFETDLDLDHSLHLGDDSIPSSDGTVYEPPPGYAPYGDDTGYMVVAVGNLDDDPVLDVWVVGSEGAPENVIDDLAD